MKHKILISCLLLVIALASCDSNNIIPGKKKKSKPQPIAVNVITIDSCLTHTSTKDYIGILEAKQTTAMSFTYGGKIKAIYVSEGQEVQKGQLIAEVDSRQNKSSYLAAKAKLKQAEDAYKRLKMVYDKGSLAEVQWVEMQTKLAEAQSMESMAKKMLDDCKMHAPTSGIASAIVATVGANTAPSVPILNILKVDTINIKLSIPETEINSLKLNDKAVISVPAIDNYNLQGTITEKSISANIISHTYPVKISIPNPDNELMPGMVSTAKVSLNKEYSNLLLPINAIQFNNNKNYVWKIKNNKAERINVQTGSFIDNGVLIKEGLNVGDTIVIKGQHKLSNGCSVKITK